MNTAPLTIQLQRLQQDLHDIGQIGLDPVTGGINRPSFSEDDIQARHWLKQRMQEAGLGVEIDSVANVIGRWGKDDKAPALLIGSHLDSVPQGGKFDGTLGVLAGLEVVRSLQDAGIEPPFPIEVIATSEEEGRFGGMLGAEAMTGELDLDWFHHARDDQGLLLTDCMQQQGFDPGRVLEAQRPDSSMLGFLELHIEQGPVLEREKLPIGIVEGIAGVFHWSVSFRGQSNHAGTTPMALRRDAFAAVAEFAASIPNWIEQISANSRLTIGKVELQPGFAHTVPGYAEFSLVGKDFLNQDLQHLQETTREKLKHIAAQHELELRIEHHSQLDSQDCDTEIIKRFKHSAEELQLPYKLMYSGAGHDTQIFARHTRAGMIFVPSHHGISHAPEEHTDWPDIEQGCNLLLHCVGELIKSSS